MIKSKTFNDYRYRVEFSKFLSIKDEELKKFLYISDKVSDTKFDINVTDNDEKYCIYEIEKTIKVNPTNQAFYVQSKLINWISYNKKDKKIKISKNSRPLVMMLLEQKFGENASIIDEFIPKFTGTFCKKVIQNKINTIRDVLEYHKSYTIRDKSLSIKTVYNAIANNALYSIRLFKDPENVDFSNVSKLCESGNPFSGWNLRKMMIAKPIKFDSTDDAKNMYRRYDDWYNEKSTKYVEIQGTEYEDNGYIDLEDTSSEISDIFIEDYT